MNIFEVATNDTDFVCYNLDNIVSIEVESEYSMVVVKTVDGDEDRWPFGTAEEAREFYGYFVAKMVLAKRGAEE